MADSIELIKPRRKRGRFTKLEYPFPVPEHKDIDEQKWFYYEGFLRENCVVVENIGDLTLLYKMVLNDLIWQFMCFNIIVVRGGHNANFFLRSGPSCPRLRSPSWKTC